MAKKMRLKLEDIEVKSFVTSINDAEKKDVKGGTIVICTLLTILLSCIDDTVEDWTEQGPGVCSGDPGYCGGGGGTPPQLEQH